MTWLAVKTFFKKAWVWIKKHWYIPVLLLLIGLSGVLGIFGFGRNKQLAEMLEVNKKSYQDQIKAIEESHALEIKKRDELYETYVETMKKLNKDHDIDLDNLSKEKKEKMDKLVKKYEGSPEELAKELSEMFGVDYVE